MSLASSKRMLPNHISIGNKNSFDLLPHYERGVLSASSWELPLTATSDHNFSIGPSVPHPGPLFKDELSRLKRDHHAKSLLATSPETETGPLQEKGVSELMIPGPESHPPPPSTNGILQKKSKQSQGTKNTCSSAMTSTSRVTFLLVLNARKESHKVAQRKQSSSTLEQVHSKSLLPNTGTRGTVMGTTGMHLQETPVAALFVLILVFVSIKAVKSIFRRHTAVSTDEHPLLNHLSSKNIQRAIERREFVTSRNNVQAVGSDESVAGTNENELIINTVIVLLALSASRTNKDTQVLEPDLRKRVILEWSPLLPMQSALHDHKHSCFLFMRRLSRLSKSGIARDTLLDLIEEWTTLVLTARQSRPNKFSSMIKDLYSFLHVEYSLPTSAIITLMPFLLAKASIHDICCDQRLGKLVFSAEARLGEFYEDENQAKSSSTEAYMGAEKPKEGALSHQSELYHSKETRKISEVSDEGPSSIWVVGRDQHEGSLSNSDDVDAQVGCATSIGALTIYSISAAEVVQGNGANTTKPEKMEAYDDALVLLHEGITRRPCAPDDQPAWDIPDVVVVDNELVIRLPNEAPTSGATSCDQDPLQTVEAPPHRLLKDETLAVSSRSNHELHTLCATPLTDIHRESTDDDSEQEIVFVPFPVANVGLFEGIWDMNVQTDEPIEDTSCTSSSWFDGEILKESFSEEQQVPAERTTPAIGSQDNERADANSVEFFCGDLELTDDKARCAVNPMEGVSSTARVEKDVTHFTEGVGIDTQEEERTDVQSLDDVHLDGNENGRVEASTARTTMKTPDKDTTNGLIDQCVDVEDPCFGRDLLEESFSEEQKVPAGWTSPSTVGWLEEARADVNSLEDVIAGRSTQGVPSVACTTKDVPVECSLGDQAVDGEGMWLDAGSSCSLSEEEHVPSGWSTPTIGAQERTGVRSLEDDVHEATEQANGSRKASMTNDAHEQIAEDTHDRTMTTGLVDKVVEDKGPCSDEGLLKESLSKEQLVPAALASPCTETQEDARKDVYSLEAVHLDVKAVGTNEYRRVNAPGPKVGEPMEGHHREVSRHATAPFSEGQHWWEAGEALPCEPDVLPRPEDTFVQRKRYLKAVMTQRKKFKSHSRV